MTAKEKQVQSTINAMAVAERSRFSYLSEYSAKQAAESVSFEYLRQGVNPFICSVLAQILVLEFQCGNVGGKTRPE